VDLLWLSGDIWYKQWSKRVGLHWKLQNLFFCFKNAGLNFDGHVTVGLKVVNFTNIWPEIRLVFLYGWFWEAFIYSQFVLLISWQKQISTKAICKMRVKLLKGVNFTNILQAFFYTKVQLQFVLVIFWCKNISAKATLKLLV